MNTYRIFYKKVETAEREIGKRKTEETVSCSAESKHDGQRIKMDGVIARSLRRSDPFPKHQLNQRKGIASPDKSRARNDTPRESWASPNQEEYKI